MLDSLFSRQLPLWPACQERYAALGAARSRTIVAEGREYLLTFNPARAKSAKAVISADGKVGGERPCFLCQHALPAEQLQEVVDTLPLHHKYIVAVNPYPIVDHHFTIIAQEHTRQELKGRVWDMAFFADMFPDYVIFFNGACSGASAPDHMHFQAVPKREVPMLQWSEDQKRQMGVTSQMPKVDDTDHKNILTWTDGSEAYWLVIDRSQHRPWQYYAGTSSADAPEKAKKASEDEQVIISPAALEFCGLVPLCREEDFEKMTPELLLDLLNQCWKREPMLHVGIMEGQQIRFSAEERVHSMNYIADNSMRDVMDYSSNRAEISEMQEYWCHTEPFTLEQVTIGKQFHWQQQEDQIFRGSLHIIAKEGQLHAINLIPVEQYLESVISSEMSATNSLELLKAHAIISRSWVMRQLSCRSEELEMRSEEYSSITHNISCESSKQLLTPYSSLLIKFWDHSDHKLYDVCADDHCQRYQGITRAASPLVQQAVAETRGMVLTDAEGEICDARFSKCCGGKTELFSTCWQDKDYDYLQSVDDPYCDPAFIATLPGGLDGVLSQVLNNYDQQTVDFHDWKVSYKQEELSALVEEKLHLQLGTIQQLEACERGASGRIKTLRVVGSEKTVVIGKELMIRKALSETHLYSSWFDVETSTNENGVIVFTLQGKGWGHGVGLCQIGAAAMALKGFSAEEILQHYYPGALITTKY